MGSFKKEFQRIVKLSEVRDPNFWRAVFAEIIVTMLFMIFACGNTIQLPGQPKNSLLHGSLTVAFTVAVLAATFWNISGGHFNPAVTFALLINGKVSITRFVFYLVAQTGGSKMMCSNYIFV